MKINIDYIPSTYELAIGTIDGETYGTSHLLYQEMTDEDNVYPH